MRVGFAGAGRMGGPMVRRLLAAGHTVTVYGDPILHVGARGAGQQVKLLNNAVFAARVGEFIGKDLTVVRQVAAELGIDLGALDDAHAVLDHLLTNGDSQ